MAEALVNARMGDTWQAFSAGTQPAGYVHPKARAVFVLLLLHFVLANADFSWSSPSLGAMCAVGICVLA
jgi:hypothetical protein